MSTSPDGRPVRLAVVGTDLKFIRPLLDRFQLSGRFEVRIDEWPKFRAHDQEATRNILAWAETIVCEWAGPNAVLASRAKRSDQRLIVRLHRMELGHPEWRDIDIDAVDLVVTVGAYYHRKVLETTGWPEDKVVLVPNFVDPGPFDLPKTGDAIHHLGMIGAASARKRLDLGLDVLALLRASDPSYRLFVKGANPWDLKWVDDRPDEVEYFAGIKERLETDPLLQGAVTFDPEGPDVAEWLQKIGFLLSTSDDESFHLSPAEGAVSRSVPVIRPWPGADEVYEPEWVVDGPRAMADRVLSLAEVDAWEAAGRRARAEMIDKYDIEGVAATWMSDVLGHDRARGPMRISIVSTRNPYNDPEIRALVASLASVGHEITVVSKAAPPDDLPDEVSLRQAIPRRSALDRLLRRLGIMAGEDDGAAIRRALTESDPELVYAHRIEDLAVAEGVDAPVVRKPTWPAPTRDLVTMAPHSPALSMSPSTSWADADQSSWPSHRPEPGRFDGTTAVIAYRVTPTSPGRYLEMAMRRSGMAVEVMDGELDWGRVGPDTSFVVVVESLYPAMSVKGTKPRIPTFFWVHHGEHHLAANLRLARRYQADAVLMAHSWHLAHRFPVPTYRFPFAVAPELDSHSRPWHERRFDVALVGAGIGGTGTRYDRRREIAEGLRSDSQIGVELAYGLKPDEMMALYGNARIVVNDGGPRHFPITMRVFESLGAGALLVTEDIPGTDTLLEPGVHYVAMDQDVASQVRRLLAEPGSEAIAAAGARLAADRHTYDHRVDRLHDLASRVAVSTTRHQPHPALTPIAAVIDQDVDVQHLAVFGDPMDLGLDDRAVRLGHVGKLRERSIDAVVIGRGAIADVRAAVLAARGYVYADRSHRAEVTRVLAEERPDAQIDVIEVGLRADIGGTEYRTRAADHPLSS